MFSLFRREGNWDPSNCNIQRVMIKPELEPKLIEMCTFCISKKSSLLLTVALNCRILLCGILSSPVPGYFFLFLWGGYLYYCFHFLWLYHWHEFILSHWFCGRQKTSNPKSSPFIFLLIVSWKRKKAYLLRPVNFITMPDCFSSWWQNEENQ